MWVRSQDKRYLVDVKRCFISSYYHKHQDKYRIAGLICESQMEGSIWALGTYKTEEKAMSVLDELQFRIARSESGVYQMPKDEADEE